MRGSAARRCREIRGVRAGAEAVVMTGIVVLQVSQVIDAEHLFPVDRQREMGRSVGQAAARDLFRRAIGDDRGAGVVLPQIQAEVQAGNAVPDNANALFHSSLPCFAVPARVANDTANDGQHAGRFLRRRSRPICDNPAGSAANSRKNGWKQ